MSGASSQWFGKAIGGILGFFTAGPIGSLVGVMLGHQFDQTVTSRLRGPTSSPQQISRLFFEVAFEIMGHIAKIDGRVSEDEVRVARRIMQGMRLSQDQTREAIERFTRGKSAAYALDERLAALAEHLGSRSDLARAFVQIQLQAAVGVGQIGPDKRQLLWRVASALGVGRADVAQLEALARSYEQRGTRGAQEQTTANIADAYRVLGIAASSTNAEVKTAYRRLMNVHHPDKLVARGLPESMANVAEQKTLEIRGAYETIKARRGFK